MNEPANFVAGDMNDGCAGFVVVFTFYMKQLINFVAGDMNDGCPGFLSSPFL
jgi:hypothetical protein